MKKTQLAGTQAEGQHKQNSTKPGKTRAQKDAHNESCVRYRQKIKRRRKDLEEVETKYYEMVPEFEKMQTENQQMKRDLEERNSKIRKLENQMQQYRATLEAEKRNESRMRQNPIEWKVNGQNFTYDELLISYRVLNLILAVRKWLLSDTDGQDGQASVLNNEAEFVGLGATEAGNLPLYAGQDYTKAAYTAFHVGSSSAADDFEGPGATGTGNFPLSTADIFQQRGFDQDYTNTAYAANHAGSSVAGVWTNSVAGSLDASYDLSEFGITNQHDNFFNIGLDAGVPTHSAAVPSGANPELPIAHDATNNHENAVIFPILVLMQRDLNHVKIHLQRQYGNGLCKTQHLKHNFKSPMIHHRSHRRPLFPPLFLLNDAISPINWMLSIYQS